MAILLHTKRLRLESTENILWHNALKKSTKWIKPIKIGTGGNTREESFSGIMNNICPDNLHIWGCHVYVLEYPIQKEIYTIQNWDSRPQVRVYLEKSPLHVGSVELGLCI